MNKAFVFDTNVFVTHAKPLAKYVDTVGVSSVVLYELTATTIDNDTLKFLERMQATAKKDGRLQTPNDVDWWETAKMVRRLRELNLTSKTTTPTVLQNDALITRLAWLNESIVVTSDVDDFELLKKVLPQSPNKPELLIVHPDKFFS